MPENIRKHLAAEAARRGPVAIETSIFRTAVDFHEAAQRSFEQRTQSDGRTPFPFMPAIVCLAFACEMYLKALNALSTGKGRHGHRLNVLFAGLTADHVDQIERRFAGRTGKAPAELKSDLVAFGNAFVEWRYIYEQSTAQIDMISLGQLAATLYEVGTGLRPDWVQHQYIDGRLRAAMQGAPLAPYSQGRPSEPFVP